MAELWAVAAMSVMNALGVMTVMDALTVTAVMAALQAVAIKVAAAVVAEVWVVAPFLVAETRFKQYRNKYYFNNHVRYNIDDIKNILKRIF